MKKTARTRTKHAKSLTPYVFDKLLQVRIINMYELKRSPV